MRIWRTSNEIEYVSIQFCIRCKTTTVSARLLKIIKTSLPLSLDLIKKRLERDQVTRCVDIRERPEYRPNISIAR
jgi:hypothetical protein